MKNEEISVVVQGPVVDSTTAKCLESIRKILPGSEIILSTWKGANVKGLQYDILVENEDPGAYNWHESPLKNNTNRQIVSSRNGILRSTRTYVLKIRTEAYLESDRFKTYFGLYPARADDWRIFSERILINTLHSGHPDYPPYSLFCPSDWYHFGLREDVLTLWDIPLYPEPDTTLWFVKHPHPGGNLGAISLYTPEQMIWIGCLKKFGNLRFKHHSDNTDENKALSPFCLANNFVILHPWQSGIRLSKYRYAENVSDAYRTVYSHQQWIRLYNAHCKPVHPSALSKRDRIISKMKIIDATARLFYRFIKGYLSKIVRYFLPAPK